MKDEGTNFNGSLREEALGFGLEEGDDLEIFEDKGAEFGVGFGEKPGARSHEAELSTGLKPESGTVNKGSKEVAFVVGKVVREVGFEDGVHEARIKIGWIGDDEIVGLGEEVVDFEEGLDGVI